MEQISTCSPWKGPHAGAGGCLKEDVTLWGAPRWSRFAGRVCEPVGDPRWSSLFLKDFTPWKGPKLGQFVKSCSPWEGLTLKKFVENCLCEKNLHAEAGAECEESSP